MKTTLSLRNTANCMVCSQPRECARVCVLKRVTLRTPSNISEAKLFPLKSWQKKEDMKLKA